MTLSTLTWTPEFVTEIRTYPVRATSATAPRFFRTNMAPASAPYWPSWSVRSAKCSATDHDAIVAIFESTKGGGAFLWTPPGGTETRVRFADGSLQINQPTAAKRYEIAVALEKV